MKKSINLGKLLIIPYESFSNYVNLPSGLLDRILKLKHFEQQYFFELKTSNNSLFYVGVKEFTNDTGCIETPSWLSEIMKEDYVNITLLRNIPKGNYIKIEPQSRDFFKIPDNDKILETELAKYCLLSINQIISIKIFDEIYKLKIIEIKTKDNINSNVIDIVNINLNVDFENKFIKEEEDERLLEEEKLLEAKLLEEEKLLEAKLLEAKKKEDNKELTLEKLRELRLKYYNKKS